MKLLIISPRGVNMNQNSTLLKKTFFGFLCSLLILSQVQCGKSCSSEEQKDDPAQKVDQKTDQEPQNNQKTGSGLDLIEIQTTAGKKVTAPRYLTWFPENYLGFTITNNKAFDPKAFISEFEGEKLYQRFIEVLKYAPEATKKDLGFIAFVNSIKNKDGGIYNFVELLKKMIEVNQSIEASYNGFLIQPLTPKQIEILKNSEQTLKDEDAKKLFQEQFPIVAVTIIEGSLNQENFIEIGGIHLGCLPETNPASMSRTYKEQKIFLCDSSSLYIKLFKDFSQFDHHKSANSNDNVFDFIPQSYFQYYFSLVNGKIVAANDAKVIEQMIDLQQKPQTTIADSLTKNGLLDILTFKENDYYKVVYSVDSTKAFVNMFDQTNQESSQKSLSKEMAEVQKALDESGFQWFYVGAQIKDKATENPKIDFFYSTKFDPKKSEQTKQYADGIQSGLNFGLMALFSPTTIEELNSLNPKLVQAVDILRRVKFENQENSLLKLSLAIHKNDIKLINDVLFIGLDMIEIENQKAKERAKEKPKKYQID